MQVATKANVRTAAAAQHGMSQALRIAFSGGAVMGMCVSGLGMLGLGIFFLAFGQNIEHVTGFKPGASSIALFARVGGIYTKRPTSGQTWSAKSKPGFLKTIPATLRKDADNVRRTM